MPIIIYCCSNYQLPFTNHHSLFTIMIPRYSRPEMVAIWTDQTKYQIWFEIEAHACDALAQLGVIPKSAAKTIWEKGGFDIARIDEIEQVTKHDVIAFLTNVAEFVGDDARFLHQGMTSSDVLDTCLSVQLARASDILLADIDELLAAIKLRAYETKDFVTVGRSHFWLKTRWLLCGIYSLSRAPRCCSQRNCHLCYFRGSGDFCKYRPVCGGLCCEKIGA